MGRPREPWKRERLLEAAVQELSSRGVSGLTMKDVASRAGVSTATVHYHFSDLDGLVLGVVERALDEMYTRRLAAIEEVTDLREKLNVLIDLGVPDHLSHEVTFLYEAVAVIRANPQYAPVVRTYIERQGSLYRAVLDAGVAAGEFRPRQSSMEIARNLIALEDAFDLYRAIGASTHGGEGRETLRRYLNLALGVDL